MVFGDFASSAWGVRDATAISMDGQIYFPHSLGSFYRAYDPTSRLSALCDECKVMGLARYGKSALMDAIRRSQSEPSYVCPLI
jgi:carbamoyltransferase